MDSTRDVRNRSNLPPHPPGTRTHGKVAGEGVSGPSGQGQPAPAGMGDIGQFGDIPDLSKLLPMLDGFTGTDDPVAPPGAPPLSPPKMPFSPAEIATLVAELFAKMDDAQSDAEQMGLKLDDLQKQEAFRRTVEKIAEAAKKIGEALHKKNAVGILGTIGKVLAGIAAVALTVVTGGLAAPLAVALIAYTVIDTALTIADAISQAAGGPRLDLNDLLQEGFTKAAKLCGADDKKAAEVGQWCAFGIQLAITVATLALSIANIARAVKGTAGAVTTLASKLGNGAFKAVRMTGIVSQAIGGATQVTSGGLQISVAYDQRDAQEAQAEKMLMDAAIAVLSDMMRSTLDRLQMIAADLSAGMKTAAETVSKVGQTNIAISGAGAALV